MIDPIVMYHPSIPGSTTWTEREAYRLDHFFKGWRSFDDPYGAVGDAHVPEGMLLDSALLEADYAFAGPAYGEITTAARVTAPLVQQPLLLEATFMASSVTTLGSWTLGFCAVPVGLLATKAARRIINIPISSADGEGLPVYLRHMIPAGTAAADWTLVTQRDAGAGTFKIEANAIYSGLVTVKAA